MKHFIYLLVTALLCPNEYISAFVFLPSTSTTRSATSSILSKQEHFISNYFGMRRGYDSCLCMMIDEQDSSNEILEAMQKEKEFGKDSKEAKVAWDIVEEIDANRSHHKARSTSTYTDTSTNELIHQVDFINHVHDLSTMLTYVWKPMTPKTMSLLERLNEICSNQLKTTKIGSMSEKLANALAEAKIEMDLHGPNDRKTKEAVKKALEVSKFYQRDKVGFTHHEYKSVLDKNTVLDAIDSMKKIEHLMNLVVIESKRLEKKNN